MTSGSAKDRKRLLVYTNGGKSRGKKWKKKAACKKKGKKRKRKRSSFDKRKKRMTASRTRDLGTRKKKKEEREIEISLARKGGRAPIPASRICAQRSARGEKRKKLRL